MISFTVFATATLASLSLFIPPNTLIWIIGLFSAAFGLGARPVISDFLTRVSLISEDTFAVGEKVEVAGINPNSRMAPSSWIGKSEGAVRLRKGSLLKTRTMLECMLLALSARADQEEDAYAKGTSQAAV